MGERFLEARKSGELPKELNVDDYAHYISLMPVDLSVQSANGATKAELSSAQLRWS